MPVTAERLPPLGWPWDALADAVLRWADARDRHHAATVAGDVNAREDAAADRWRAEQDHARVRDEVARQWLAGMRAAIELYGPAFLSEWAELPPPAVFVSAVQDLEERVDAAEDAIVNLEHGPVCR
jgi:hypothetical protein